MISVSPTLEKRQQCILPRLHTGSGEGDQHENRRCHLMYKGMMDWAIHSPCPSRCHLTSLHAFYFCYGCVNIHVYMFLSGLLRWLSGNESAWQCRRCRFDPWVRKMPWRRDWQATLVFLPGKSHRRRRLVVAGGLQSTGSQRVGQDIATEHSTVCIFLLWWI